jgi:uncharacterized protein (DUF1800 family)
MTTREKITHLYRKFGLGASRAEVDAGEKRGLHPTIDLLIDYGKVKDTFPVSPWEFVFRPNNQMDMSPNAVAACWALRLACTERPMEEKLTLFWHDHFAVSGSKIENAALLNRYVETLRRNANGNFHTLLVAMTKDPAMLRWLDNDVSIKGNPNENYAREVMELFTLGIGNYTEKDVKELARALTGWGLRGVVRGGRPEETRKQIAECIATGRPIVAATYSEDLHDDAPKTILGKTSRFDTDSALDLLASRPQSAKHLCAKLWEWFGYPKPEPKLVERLAKVFLDNKYEVKPVLLAMATSREFWSEKCLRGQVKSPVDFAVAAIRQLGIGQAALDEYRKSGGASQGGDAMMMSSMTSQSGGLTSGEPKPIDGPAAQLGRNLTAILARQGMRLLYPPDVAGWDWGEAWVSPAMMADRIRFGEVLFGRTGAAPAAMMSKAILEADPQDSAAVVKVICDVLDAPNIPERQETLIKAFESQGGLASLKKPQSAQNAYRVVAKLIFSMPEYQMC